MLECWEEDPSKRPPFTKLKQQLNRFMQDKCHFIHFSSPDSGYDNLSETYNPTASSTFSDFLTITSAQGNGVLPGYDSLSAVRRSPSPIQQDFLAVGGQGIRHHLSEPNLEGRDGGMDEGGDEAGNSLRRTRSNPYVQTPKHDAKNQIRRSFEWNFSPPQITVQGEEEV